MALPAPSRVATSGRNERQPPLANRARRTDSLLVAPLATTQGPVLIGWEHDHIHTIAEDLDNPSLPRPRHGASTPLSWCCCPLKAPIRKGTRANGVDQAEPQLPSENDTPIS